MTSTEFESKVIPVEALCFKDIGIDSAVKYYLIIDNNIKDLYGTVLWTGMNKEGDYFYGIELDNKFKDGTDGHFKGQKLFHCQNGHGVLAPIHYVVKDPRFFESDFPYAYEIISPESFAICGIDSKLSEGYQKGIQSIGNSGYWDSLIFALFGKSDVLDFMINPMINEINDITKKFRNIMASKIVYPLRRNGFVSFHQTNEMRKIVNSYGPPFNKIEEEIDVFSLLEKLCPDEQLLSLQPYKNRKFNSMVLQLFVILEKKVRNISSEKIINVSMVQNEVMFHTLPTCLIVQLPRDFRVVHCYENVFPLKVIEISNICLDYFKKCYLCNREAIYQCLKCIERNNLKIVTGFHCDIHKCQHENLFKFPQGKIKSKSKVIMKLSAIICMNKYHFVTYLKHDEILNKWIFFDGMSSISQGIPIPELKICNEVSNFLNLSYNEMKETYQNFHSVDVKRVIADSYIFIYQNSSKSCY